MNSLENTTLLAIIVIIACIYLPLALVIPPGVVLIVSVIKHLIDWNYNREMTGDFDEKS